MVDDGMGLAGSDPVRLLMPYIDKSVRTPQGYGVLVQVFRNRVGVVLDDNAKKVTWLPPEDVVRYLRQT